MQMKNSMNRRTFLKSSAALSLAGVTSAIPQSMKADTNNVFTNEGITKSFTFNKNGKFKILQLTDTHYIADDPRSERAGKNVKEMIESEKPDLVIHTGDVIFGKPAEKCFRQILGIIADYKVPFAVAMGNHDGDFDTTRKQSFDIIKTIPYNINKGVEGIYGDSNDLITITSADGATKYVLYLFDSGGYTEDEDLKGYDYIHHSQIEWYRHHAEEFAKQNNGKPIPALAFFHIPVPEFTYALRWETHRRFKGNLGEDPCPPNVNSGLFVSMKEMGDVKAIICGHDHDDDYAMLWRGMFLMYGRFSGCDTVYNNLLPNGARVFELTEGQEGFHSWIRLYGGEIIQDLYYPDSFKSNDKA
jgi:3',5'-cyclic AMP phosphodiesterase CpdA